MSFTDLFYEYISVSMHDSVPFTFVDLPSSRISTFTHCAQWYDRSGSVGAMGAPCLVIGYVNGRAMLLRSHSDPSPVLLDTFLSLAAVQWNTAGMCGCMDVCMMANASIF